jgi:HPt (histidine-containing phosphotransfer) domain-containing protein
VSEDADPLAVLRGRFLIRCADDLVVIDGAMEDALLRLEPAFKMVIHRLSGAAGTFGFWAISEAAGPIDDLLQGGTAPDDAQLQALTKALQAALTPS